METKRCLKCNEIYPIEDFRRSCKFCAREYSRQYHHKNREKVLKRQAADREANRDQRREYDKQWRVKNKDRIKAWRCRHPDYNRIHKANRRAKLLDREGVLTLEGWLEICESQNYNCAICKSSPIEELDHILAFVAGGSNLPSNIQGLCRDCHIDKTKEDKC